PAGIPAFSKIFTISMADNGVSGAGFKTAVQPAAKAGPSFLVIIDDGKFHGVIAPTTPTGLGITSNRFDLIEEGIHSPYPLLASSAYHSKKLAAPTISPLASWSGLPCSVVKICASRSVSSNMYSCVLYKIRPLSRPVISLHVEKAFVAASIARFVSSAPP